MHLFLSSPRPRPSYWARERGEDSVLPRERAPRPPITHQPGQRCPGAAAPPLAPAQGPSHAHRFVGRAQKSPENPPDMGGSLRCATPRRSSVHSLSPTVPRAAVDRSTERSSFSSHVGTGGLPDLRLLTVTLSPVVVVLLIAVLVTVQIDVVEDDADQISPTTA